MLRYWQRDTFLKMQNKTILNHFILIILLTIALGGLFCFFYSHKKLSSEKLTILFCGDTAFGENYQEKHKENILKTRGYDYPLTNFEKIMSKSDLVIVNLETPITDLRESPFGDVKTFVHYSDVIEAPKYLKKYKMTNVALANNHIMDFSTEGLEQTIDVLRKNNINYFGAGLNEKEASKPLIKELVIGNKKLRLAVISTFYYRSSYERKYGFYATENSSGAYRLKIDKLAEQIKQLKKEDPNTFVVIFPHWGLNYRWANRKERTIAEKLIEETDVDLIIGHGAHMIQQIEFYKGCWVIFGLGNFIFNSNTRYDDYHVLPFSAIALLTIDNKWGKLDKSLKVYPIFTDNSKTDYLPRFLTKDEIEKYKRDLYRTNPKVNVLENELNLISTGKDEYGYYFLIKNI